VVIRRSPEGRNRNDSSARGGSSSDTAQSRREGSAVPGVGDEELVARIAARDEEALGLLVEAVRVPIFTLARQIVLDDRLGGAYGWGVKYRSYASGNPSVAVGRARYRCGAVMMLIVVQRSEGIGIR